MIKKVFIDGSAGTTGLRIYERLEKRRDISLISLSDEKRKDPVERKKALNRADIAFLCLPDEAAREAVSFIDNEKTTVIDTSTAHRTLDGWAYGFPELSENYLNKIGNSKRIAVPGCHASGFIALIFPLIESGIISKEQLLSCFSLTGYSGGGKKMIAQYGEEGRDALLDAPRLYGISQNHKHLPEMQKICGLSFTPAFNPLVCDYFSGMVVSLPIFTRLLTKKYTPDDIRKALAEFYGDAYFVKVMPEGEPADGFIGANNISGTNMMQIFVNGNHAFVFAVKKVAVCALEVCGNRNRFAVCFYVVNVAGAFKEHKFSFALKILYLAACKGGYSFCVCRKKIQGVVFVGGLFIHKNVVLAEHGRTGKFSGGIKHIRSVHLLSVQQVCLIFQAAAFGVIQKA